MAKTPHFNVYLTTALYERICIMAKHAERSRSKTVVWLARIGLSLETVPSEWTVDASGRQVATGIASGVSTNNAGVRVHFLAPMPVQVAIDNFRHDNNFESFSEALRVLLSAAFASLDNGQCDYCKGLQP